MAETEGIGDIHNYLEHFSPKDVAGVVSKTEVIGKELDKTDEIIGKNVMVLIIGTSFTSEYAGTSSNTILFCLF
jgi:hypothetical protein